MCINVIHRDTEEGTCDVCSNVKQELTFKHKVSEIKNVGVLKSLARIPRREPELQGNYEINLFLSGLDKELRSIWKNIPQKTFIHKSFYTLIKHGF